MTIGEIIQKLCKYDWEVDVGLLDMDEYANTVIQKIETVSIKWIDDNGKVYEYAINVPPDVAAKQVVTIV